MKNFEICVRGVILHKNKILVCRIKKHTYHFFPGGHVDFGEAAEKALKRELYEELGTRVKKIAFIGAVDNIFADAEDGRRHHEINLVFSVLLNKIKTQSKENHIDFRLMDIKEFSKSQVLPIALKKSLMKWLRDKKIFWAAQTS